MKKAKPKSIRTQITRMAMVVVVMCLIFAGVGFLLVERQAYKQLIKEQSVTLANVFAEHTAPAVLFDDSITALRILQALSEASSVEMACVYNQQGDLFSAYLRDQGLNCPDNLLEIESFDNSSSIEALVTRQLEGVQASSVYLRTTLDKLNALSWYSAFLMFLIGIATLLLAFPISRRFQRSISDPILKLVDVANKMSIESKPQGYLSDGGTKEIDALYNAFDTMLARLHEEESKLKDSEHLLYSVVDNSDTIIQVKDLDGRYTFVNRQFEMSTELFREQVIGKTDYDIASKELADKYTANDRQVLRDKKLLRYDETIERMDGAHVYVATKFPLFNTDGSIYATCGIFTDITDRLQMQAELQEYHQRIQLYREQSPIAVVEWDKDLKVIDWNPAAVKIFGYSRHDALDQYCKHLIFSDSKEFKKLQNAMSGDSPEFGVVVKNINQEGQEIVCKWINTPIIDERGLIIGITSLIEDITLKKQQEEQLRRGQKLDALGNLTSGIAHDFNNMLSIVMGFARLLRKREIDPEKLKHIDEIYHAAEHSADLTRKLLVFSTNVKSEPEPVDINKLLWRDQSMLQKTLTSRIELSMSLVDDLWFAWLDPGELEDAILNISINAMHAMPDVGKYTIASANVVLDEKNSAAMNLKAGEYVKLSFVDEGHGMDKKTEEHIFEPFFTTKGERGTGLGLSQVYGFVRKSGGAIKVDTAEGIGTRLDLYFPRCTVVPKDIKNKILDIQENMQGTETILIVDDVALIRRLNEIIISSHGYHVLVAESGKQALSLLAENNVDLLLTDISMPNMDGYQLADIAHRSWPSLKVLILSGYQEIRHIETNSWSDQVDYLQKPASPDELLSRIRKMLDAVKVESTNT